MTCANCGGYVEWKGPLSNLTHTECAKCGGINCQEPEPQEETCRYCHHEECECSDFEVVPDMGDK